MVSRLNVVSLCSIGKAVIVNPPVQYLISLHHNKNLWSSVLPPDGKKPILLV